MVQSLLKSSIPLFVGGSYHLLKSFFSYVFENEPKSSFSSAFPRSALTKKHWFETQDNGAGIEFDFDFLVLLDKVSFGVYSNLLTFLLAMLLIDVLFEIVRNGVQGFWKEVKSSSRPRTSLSDYSAREWRLFNLVSENQIKNIFSYVVIFMILQIVGVGLSLVVQNEMATRITHHPALSSSQSPDTFTQLQMKEQEEYFDISRILEEVDGHTNEQPQNLPTSDKISLSMGNLLSSLSLSVNAMVLSEDKKIAFVTIDFYGTLHIIDLSDLQSPYIMGSLNLELSSYNFRIKSLALSSDEKTLYLSNSKDLEIVDVTDPSSPKLISRTKSEIFGVGTSTPQYYKTSLAISEDTSTLYIAGLGLQIYDISDLKKPALLKAFKNDVNNMKGISRNEICLSRDGKVLFIANGSLDVYNISNPKEMKPLYSLKTESSPRSIMLSEDFKTAFLLGTSESNNEIIFEEMDISNYEVMMRVRNTIHLNHTSFLSPRFLAISPSKSKFFVLADPEIQAIDLLIFDREKQITIKNEKSLVEETFTMDFALDGKTLITGSNGQFMTIELFLNYPNSQIFSASQENLIEKISLPTDCRKMEVSEDGRSLFILRQGSDEQQDTSIFEIWDVENASEPRALSSYPLDKYISKMHLTKNYETAYLLSADLIYVLDLKNRFSVSLKKTYKTANRNQRFDYFIASSDEKTGFLIISKGNLYYLTFVDLSRDMSVIEGFVELEIGLKVYNGGLLLKDNDKTLIALNKEIMIFNLSNISTPTPIVSLPFGVNEPQPYLSSYVLSPNSKTLFVETFDQSGFRKLRIYDLSILTSPRLISEKYLPKNEGLARQPGLSLSSDLKTAFVFQENSLIRLNMTDLKQPKVSGVVPLSKAVSIYTFSPDGQTIYASSGKGIRIINSKIQYTMFLKQEKFMLGEKYFDSIAVLNLTKSVIDYSLVNDEAYKIIKLSLLDVKIAPNKVDPEVITSALPSWMAFDRESNILTVEPKKQGDIGTYTLKSTFSLKIPREIFNSLGTIERPVSSEDLVAWLISLDYVDPQLFLTANFGPFETFYLPSNFSLYRREIYNLLKKYHIETCTLFEVVSSLKIAEVEPQTIAVSSLSTNNIKVEIKLEPKNNSEAKFVSRPYGSLLPIMRDNNKTKVSLEGSIKEINAALNSVIVNFENGTYSDANIVMNDGLNPQISTGLKNISNYFKANQPPKVNLKINKTIQEQIDSAVVQTGVYFTFAFSEDSFEDDFAEGLNYELRMAKNNTAFPNWLSFHGLTLKGTPPEEILGRDLDLVLIAKNEYKQCGVPFKLHISMSAVFWLKLVMRYSPYILTLIGLIVSANKIFNILRKDFYKHSKEFYVGVGEEISNNVIFPVSFIKEEQKQSQLVLKQLGDINVTDFIDQDREVIDKEKVISKIKEAIRNMPMDLKKQITLYPNPIIDQMVINKFIWMQLDSEHERKTRNLFEYLKADCLEVVERDSSSVGFTINHTKFNKLMKKVQISPGEGNESFGLAESLISDDLDIPEGVNINLLKDAILAFAFESHSIGIDPINVDIGIKQKVPSNFLWKFLKLDMKEIYLNDKNRINYGINYQIINDTLRFYGIAQDNFKGKTLVVQIKTSRQRIMKEISINGVSSDFQKGDISIIRRDERELRGQGYEIF